MCCHGKDDQILSRSVPRPPTWTMNSRAKRLETTGLTGNETGRPRGYTSVWTQHEGASGGVRQGRRVVNARRRPVWALGLGDAFMVAQLHHTAGDLEKQKGNNSKYLAVPESTDVIFADKEPLGFIVFNPHNSYENHVNKISNNKLSFPWIFKCLLHGRSGRTFHEVLQKHQLTF